MYKWDKDFVKELTIMAIPSSKKVGSRLNILKVFTCEKVNSCRNRWQNKNGFHASFGCVNINNIKMTTKVISKLTIESKLGTNE